jgi:hypothetical protein
MNDDEIRGLAKVMAPIVRECVTDAICKSMIVPPELAEQLAAAVRLLHEEPPPIVERSQASPKPTMPRITRVERDEQGNFVPVYE